MLKIYNTLSRSKEAFKPIDAGKIRLYVCGITVYDYLHLGHARMLLVFDMVTRYLRMRGYEVVYVRNITDIDDKIIQRAGENGESIRALTERFITAMHEDEDALSILRPDQEPRASDHIDQMIGMISRLIDNKHAYVADGDVFYDVSAYPDYGRLSGKKLDELRTGARIDVQAAKDDPLDFVLWKAAKMGEPSWESPWGAGRPGWHIECSAMATHCLGEHFDIHGGGQDLQFPHHENEIAQSSGASGRPFVNLWMHNGFVRIADKKMAKSAGNSSTVRELLTQYQPEVIRFFILSSHYRSPLHYSTQHLEAARAALQGLYISLRELEGGGEVLSAYVEQFRQVMDDDFNTPRAIAILHELAHAINRAKDKQSSEVANLAATLRHLGGVLGILGDEPAAFLRWGSPAGEDGLSDAQIEQYIEERTRAKASRDYARADEIRAHLSAHRVIVEDRPDGSRWRRA